MSAGIPMTEGPLNFQSARCGISLRAWGLDLMRARNDGLPDVWVASVDLWWWCARLMFRMQWRASRKEEA